MAVATSTLLVTVGVSVDSGFESCLKALNGGGTSSMLFLRSG